MSDEFCAGVQILLKRMESNPDEFINPNEYRWQTIASGVFARKQGRADSEGAGAVRGLTDAEIDALHTALVKLARPAFDEYVMKEILAEPEENLKYRATERYVQGWTDPRMAVNVPPGTMLTVSGGGSGGSGGSGQVKLGGGSGSNAALRKMVDEQIQQKKQHRKESALSRIKKGLGL
jgi:hypothetical protein